MRLEEGLEQTSVVKKLLRAQTKGKIWERRLLGVKGKNGKKCRKKAKRKQCFKERTTREIKKMWNKK